MALAADRKPEYREGIEIEIPVATATQIYAGSLVMANSGGFAVPGADTSGCNFLGVAQENVNNPSGGALTVRVRRVGVCRFPATSITQAMLGTIMELVDDQTFDDSAGTTNHIKCGQLVKYVSATEGWIDIGRRA